MSTPAKSAKSLRCHEFGGETAKGEPCRKPAGWGTDASGGRCKHHRAGRPERDGEAGERPPPPDAPETLSEEAASVWNDVVDRFEFSAEERLVLRGGLESWDIYRAARERLAEEGPVSRNPDSGAVKRNPSALVARDAFRDYRDALRHLELGLEELEGD